MRREANSASLYGLACVILIPLGCLNAYPLPQANNTPTATLHALKPSILRSAHGPNSPTPLRSDQVNRTIPCSDPVSTTPQLTPLLLWSAFAGIGFFGALLGLLYGGLRRRPLLRENHKLTENVAVIARQLSGKDTQIVTLRAVADRKQRARIACEQQIARMQESKQRQDDEKQQRLEAKKRETNEEEQLETHARMQRKKEAAEKSEADRRENITDPDNQLRFVEAANLRPSLF